MRTRIERARVLIRSTQASFGDIAAECGFSDQAHFNRVFRKLMGLTPGTWRRSQVLP
jgi:transcriptional regulator GlxA family with amidase domain